MSLNESESQQSSLTDINKSKLFEYLNSGNSSSGVSEDEELEISASVKKTNSRVMSENSERYFSLPNKSQEKFLRTIFDTVLSNAIFEGTKRENKVLEWTDPEELKKKFNMDLKDEADSDEELLKLTNDTIKYSVKTGHPYFVNQLFSCVDPYGFAGQLITDALNPSVYTYEVSPCFILMEEVVLKEMRKIVGWKDGEGDGIFCPGGSIANGYSISCARYRAFPEVKVIFSCAF
jgi:sulfinoalanine decarboxylase